MFTPTCRLCGAELLHSLVDLGLTPLTDLFPTPKQAAAGADRSYPLHARVCEACWLVQVDPVPAPETTERDEPFYPATAPGRDEQARRFAATMIERFALGPDSLVMNIGSNDGHLLQQFHAEGVRVVGVESRVRLAVIARKSGIATETLGLNPETAMRIVVQRGRGDLVVVSEGLGRVPDLFGFAAGLTAILRPHGVAVCAFPHLASLIETVQFDTIQHGQVCNLSLLVTERVFHAVGLRIFDVERLPAHGGSLRVFICHMRAPFILRPASKAIRALEAAAGLDRPDVYVGFAARVAEVQRGFRAFLAERLEAGRRIAAYGATARGNVLLNSCGVTRQDIACVADRNPAKQGRLMSGSHIPIVAPETLMARPPDDLLILPWHLAADIAAELKPLRESGTLLWTAFPKVQQI